MTVIIHEPPPVPRPARPEWLKVRVPSGESYSRLKRMIDAHRLNTVCEEARCPNMGECWTAGTATFMILGDVCTRSCGFCAVKTGRPEYLDLEEPARVADAIRLCNRGPDSFRPFGVGHIEGTSFGRTPRSNR